MPSSQTSDDCTEGANFKIKLNVVGHIFDSSKIDTCVNSLKIKHTRATYRAQRW